MQSETDQPVNVLRIEILALVCSTCFLVRSELCVLQITDDVESKGESTDTSFRIHFPRKKSKLLS